MLKIDIGIALLLSLMLCLSAKAQIPSGPGIQVAADSMERDSRNGRIVLKGNVHVAFQGQILNADRATIFLKEKRVLAEGNVILQSPQVHAEGSRLEFNYESNTGLIYDGFIKSGQVVFEGRLVEKLGENEYVATDAVYTACETCPPAWSFSGKSIHAELGGYARISRPVMRVAGVPVLILPGLIVPLKSQRQTGFLTPSLTFSSRGGTAIGQEFFWAISRSRDLTLSLTRYDQLGYKSGMEYRYVLSEDSRGFLRAGHIRDKKIKTEEPQISEDFDRWFVNYRHLYKLPDNFTHRLSVDAASDLRYPRDFYLDLPFNGDPALENKMSLTKNTKRQHFSAEAIMYTNLLKSDPRAGNEDAVHRFPEVRYALTETRLFDTNWLVNMEIDYVNFARGGLSYDDVRTPTSPNDPCDPLREDYTPSRCVGDYRDGSFDVNHVTGVRDIIRTGQRLDIKPNISYPMQIAKVFSLTPSVTYRETLYDFNLSAPVNQVLGPGDTADNYSNFAARRYVQTDLVAKTRFGRVFQMANEDVGSDSVTTRLKHEFEPEVSYSRIPWIRRPNHGFFGDFQNQPYSQTNEPISDDDVFGRNRLQFDYNDRVFDKNLINFQLTNRLTRKRWISGVPEYKTIALLRLSQAYDFNEAKSSDKPEPWSAINGLLDVRLDHFETYTESTYYPYAKVNNISSRMKVLNNTGDFLQLSYFRSILVDERNQLDPNSKTEILGFGLGFTSRYLDVAGGLSYSNITFKVQGWNSDVYIKPPGNCWGIKIIANQTVGGPLEYRFNAAFNYGGE